MNINASIIGQCVDALAEQIRDPARYELGIHDPVRLKSLTFVFLCVQTVLDLDENEAFNCLTEGGGDFGVDALHISEEHDGEFRVTLFQAKYRSRLDAQANFPENGIERLINAIRYLTLTCDKFYNALQGSDYQVKVENLQIINGGQTSMTIFRTLNELSHSLYEPDLAASVLIRLYQLPTDNEDLVQQTGRNDITSGVAAEAVLSVWRERPHQARFYARERFGKLCDLIFTESLTGAQVAVAVLLYRMAENRRRRPPKDDPLFVRYASCFVAMQMGKRLLRDLGVGADGISHQNFPTAETLIEKRGEAYLNEALDDIQKAVDELYGGREVSLQQLSATFRRGDLIEILKGNGSIMPTVLTSLTQAVRLAGLYNPEAEVAPACILWPDGEGQWTSILPHLLDEMPELIVLGKYDPAQRRGPAIWLRCVIAGVIDDTRLPEQRTPIIYLPGVSRQQLRDVENCPDALAPLVELQFRGTYWSQANGRDWTVLAFLKSRQGVDLDVAQDNDSKQAMLAALGHLLNEELSYLKSMRLDKHFLNLLIAGGDPARELLKWLDEEESFRATRTDDQWRAFVDLCQSQWGFNPETEGPIGAATKLASREGPWNAIWDRFREAPSRYPGIPVRIRSAEPPRSTILWLTDDDGRFDGWPQWNDEQEEALRQALLGLEMKTPKEVRTQLLELERQHGRRRQAVWAQLGDAALAQALEPLSELAAITQIGLDAGTIDDLVTGYANTGWKADDAVLRALAFAHMPQDIEAVTAAIRGVYLPWVDDAAHYLQRITEEQGYPGGTIAHAPAIEPTPGECILFVDGLRFDAAKRLVKMLELAGLTVTEDMAWAALPSITSTAKPAVSPVRHAIRGDHANTEFVPQVGQTGQSLTTYHFRRLLSEAGWQVPGSSEHGDCEGSAWFEFGNIDEAGHHRQIRLAGALDELLYDIGERIKALLSAGWKGIRVVTDHGWLLMPGGLPKVELPSAQTENKWGRFAMLKPGAPSNVRLFPWYWNPDRLVAIAGGVRAFRQGMIYTHGGLSLQECLTLQLRVTSATGTLAGTPFRIASVTWQGLRCRIVADGPTSGVSVDIRLQPGNPSSSVVATVRALRDDGTGSVVVDDDGLIGETATVVFIAEDGRLVAQTITTIGGDGP